VDDIGLSRRRRARPERKQSHERCET
jgi:hypothetical protein